MILEKFNLIIIDLGLFFFGMNFQIYFSTQKIIHLFDRKIIRIIGTLILDHQKSNDLQCIL